MRQLEKEAAQKKNEVETWAIEFRTNVGEARALADQIDRSRAAAQEEGLDWSSPTKEELDSYRSFGDWDAAVHVSWLKIIVEKRPKIDLKSPEANIDNVQLNVAATGQLWAKHP